MRRSPGPRIAGSILQVLVLTYAASNALLVISYADRPGSLVNEALNEMRYLGLAACLIQEKVSDAALSCLLESRAAAAERLRVTSELVDLHSTIQERSWLLPDLPALTMRRPGTP
jgi:hypothetical protein